MNCRVCETGIDISGMSRREAAAATGVTEWAVRQHARRCSSVPSSPEPAAFEAPPGYTISGRVGISVNEGLRGTTRNIRANFVPVPTEIPRDVTEAWRAAMMGDNFAAGVPAVDPLSGAYVITIADPQLGKKGTEEAVENWKRSVASHCIELAQLWPSHVHIAFMGDEYEGVMGNYTNQPYTVELSLSRQLELAYDMMVWTVREVAKAAPYSHLTVSSVVSNHGEWTRFLSKEPHTSRNDNGSTFLARQVGKLFGELEQFGGPSVDFFISRDRPGVIVPIGGTDVYFTHGYIEKGRGAGVEQRTRDAMQRQILADTERFSHVSIFVTAHYHHQWMQHFEGRTVMGCPALEARKSSEYMLDQFGVWSDPGSLGFVVKDGVWSNLSVR